MTDCKIAPKIEAEHRSEVYHATPDALRALDDAEMSSVASEEERLMEKLHATPPRTALATLLADGDAYKLYEKFGFKKSAPESIGMLQRL